jgi:hypothetical protein
VNQLRSLERRDIPQIAALRRRVFSHSAQGSDAALADYYRLLFFESPWRDERFPSLVQEGANGEIIGFVGAIPRPMLLGAERITAVTSTELMVAPEARGLLGAKLLRRLFDGPQELTYSDRSTDQARALYEGYGGHLAIWHSAYWSASLDGRRISFETGTSGAPGNVAARVLRRAGRLLERISTRGMVPASVTTQDAPLLLDTVVTLTRKLAGKSTLIPDYEPKTLAWLLQRLAERKNSGKVISAQISQGKDAFGWFIYEIRADGEAEVIQLGALPGRETLVFDHLLSHAASEGSAVLRGRLDRRFATVISERGLPITIGQPWSVVRSSRPELTAQFLTGNAFFSRLDAEWWIGA